MVARISSLVLGPDAVAAVDDHGIAGFQGAAAGAGGGAAGAGAAAGLDDHRAGALSAAVGHGQGGLTGGDGGNLSAFIHGGNAVVAAAPGIGAGTAGGSQRDGIIAHGHGELLPGAAQIRHGQGLRQGSGIHGFCGGILTLRALGRGLGVIRLTVLRHGDVPVLLAVGLDGLLHLLAGALSEKGLGQLVTVEQIHQQRGQNQEHQDQHGAQQAGLPAAGHPLASLTDAPADLLSLTQRLLLFAEGAAAVCIRKFLPTDGAANHGH